MIDVACVSRLNRRETHRSRLYRNNRFRPRSTEQTLGQPHLLLCSYVESHCFGRCQKAAHHRHPLHDDKETRREDRAQVARRNAADLRSLAANRGYESKAFRDELRGNGVRPLIKHRIFVDQAHARLRRACAKLEPGVSRNGSQSGRLQSSPERPISIKPTAVYRNSRAKNIKSGEQEYPLQRQITKNI
jgi:hypothetical protein